MSNRALLVAVLATSVAACWDDPSPTEVGPSSPPRAIEIASGDAQTGTVDNVLSMPLVVRVTDARGRPVRYASVFFEVVGGGGAIIGPRAASDSSGLARALWRLGTSAAAEQRARAVVTTASSASLDHQVSFHASALPGAPWVVGFASPAGDPIEPAPSFTRTVVARSYDFFGNPVPGAVLQWSGPGTLRADETTTDENGAADNEWTVSATSGALLGPGVYWITVSVAGSLSSSALTANYTQLVGESRLAAVSLATGRNHSCAVVEGGEIYCWGDNEGLRTPRVIAVGVNSGESFTQVVAGGSHTCALTKAGKAYCWGTNSEGQLGDGTLASRAQPLAVEGNHAFVSLTAGSSHTCGLTDSGAAYCWGANDLGQLGDGSIDSHTVPTAVVGDARFTSVTAGAEHTCGLTTDSRTLCWGSDEVGQLGTTAPIANCRVECARLPVPADRNFVRVSAGADFTCGLDADGAAWCWGGHLKARTRVGGESVRFTDIVGGLTNSACGITSDGRAFCWDFVYIVYDDYYYYPDEAGMSEPQLVEGNRVFSSVRVGNPQTCGLERGTTQWIVCWRERNNAYVVLRAGRP